MSENKNMEPEDKKIGLSTKLKGIKRIIIILVAIMVVCIVGVFIEKQNTKIASKEEEELYQKVEEYLIQLETSQYEKEMKQFENDYHHDDFKVFTDIAKLGIKHNGEETYVYVWALIESYYVHNEELVSSGSSMAYKFTIKDGEIMEYQIPEDGDGYAKSMERIFPNDIREKIEEKESLVDVTKVENEVKEYYLYLRTGDEQYEF